MSDPPSKDGASGSLLQWLTSQFKQPLSLAFFVFGALLILLGLTTGLSIPILEKLVPDPSSRIISIVLGSCLLLIAIFIAYRPPSENEKDKRTVPEPVNQPIAASTPIPDDFKKTFAAKREALGFGSRQMAILDFVISEASRDKLVSQETVRKKFGLEGSETYYRLECLRLLCFIERAGKDLYGVSKAYEQERQGH